VAYVIDEAGTFETRVNQDMVELGELDEADLALLQRLIREHEEKTRESAGRRILVQWESFRPCSGRSRRRAPRSWWPPRETPTCSR